MKYRTLAGWAGRFPKSVLARGDWRERPGATGRRYSVRALHKALDLGCNFIDTAQVYAKATAKKSSAASCGNGMRNGFMSRRRFRQNFPHVATDALRQNGRPVFQGFTSGSGLDNQRCAISRPIALTCLQLHTWTRAWNRQPAALEVLRNCQKDAQAARYRHQHTGADQNALVDLMAATGSTRCRSSTIFSSRNRRQNFCRLALEH